MQLRNRGGSAVLGVSPTRYCRGFPHSLLHQEGKNAIDRSRSVGLCPKGHATRTLEYWIYRFR
ncbi:MULTISPECIES: hypothetical protein [Moorena]|uniref:hypothetical protein n=1 Tax=Moorena TaxID=1155738 RepID=UPI001054F574|nr:MULTISPECIES: hypothetical protein [Moorena]NEP30637.1 hypothetical protein [Moorena sp. SIO3B2]NEQ04818.1 hypothetical protein [Moorena sp. SIO4E2]NER87464.1 hypothetical protein [Moorena sp. SIO3A2]NET66838.1 hypothetical protein [Moorena sp. SIO1G6]